MKFELKWGKEINTADGHYDIKGVIEQIELLSNPNNQLAQWEEEFWCSYNANDFIVEAIRMPVNDVVILPYENTEGNLEMLIIKKIEE